MTTAEINLDEITLRMDELKDARARLKFELNNVEKEIEKNELKLIALLEQKNINEMVYGVYSFRLKTAERTAFDQSLFKNDHPDLFDKYRITKQTEKFEFKVIGK